MKLTIMTTALLFLTASACDDADEAKKVEAPAAEEKKAEEKEAPKAEEKKAEEKEAPKAEAKTETKPAGK